MTTQLLYLAELLGVIAVTMIVALSPRFRRRPLIFAFPRREGLIALGGLLLLAAILWAGFAGMPTPAFAAPEDLAAYTLNDAVRQVAVAALAAAPFFLGLLLRRQPLLSAGLGKQTRSASLMLGLALGLITIFLRGKIYTIIDGLSAGEGLYLAAMLAVGLSTEFIFRGYVQLRLCSWLGEAPGWLATAVIYALWQMPQRLLLFGPDLPRLGLAFAEALVAGLVLGWIMRKSGNVLAPGIYAGIHNWVLMI